MKCLVDNCSNKYYAKGYCEKHYQRVKKHGNTDGIRPHEPKEIRFWKMVDKKSDSECWNWKGTKVSGYGNFSLGSRLSGGILAHRFSWEMNNNKEIPKGMVVMHSCDNPLCVNPNHLSIGTYMENTHDMLKKGRHTYIAHVGEKNGKSVLNEKIVREIRQSNMNHAELGRFYGVATSTIRGVRSGITWGHVE
jgi:hypothetical protein